MFRLACQRRLGTEWRCGGRWLAPRCLPGEPTSLKEWWSRCFARKVIDFLHSTREHAVPYHAEEGVSFDARIPAVSAITHVRQSSNITFDNNTGSPI